MRSHELGLRIAYVEMMIDDAWPTSSGGPASSPGRAPPPKDTLCAHASIIHGNLIAMTSLDGNYLCDVYNNFAYGRYYCSFHSLLP